MTTAARFNKAIDALLQNAGTTMHKPASRKAYKARVIPDEIFAEFQAAYDAYYEQTRGFLTTKTDR